MFGFILAAGCLIGLVAINKKRRFTRFAMYRAFRKLETTPGQEQVIRSALLRLKEAGFNFTRESKEARPELAELFVAEDLDEERVKEWFSARQQALEDLKPVVTGSLKEIHSVLDPAQRKTLKHLIESAPRAFSGRHHHHWNSAHHCGAARC